jgi:ABC-type phosphate transport system substrate-binding protein
MKKVIFLFLFCCSLAPGMRSSAQDSGFLVVINTGNEIEAMEKDQISRIFLKKITKWANGSRVEPVDLDSQSPVREAFSRDVHGKSVSSIKSYWQRMIFSGRDTPPPELDSDAKVIQFVSSHPGAIGYVSTSANIANVKVLRISD